MVIKVVNYVKTRVVKAIFFINRVKKWEQNIQHYCLTVILYGYQKVTLENALSRVFELRQELYSYLNGESYNNRKMFVDICFLRN